MYRPAGILMIAAFCAAATPVAAETFHADYSVTLVGLPVANAKFESTFTKNRFSIEGTLASVGIARLFDKIDGTTKVDGAIHRQGVQPRRFVADYTSGRKKGRTTIRFEGDRIASAVNLPPPKPRQANWVPVPPQQLRAALDPLSSTLIRATDAAEVCNRTVRVFDGEMRADLKLSHRSTGPIRGFNGEAVTCDARFVPVAGYRKGRKQIEFLKNDSRITISFMRLAETGFYTPVDASVGTQIGRLRITLRSIEAR